MPNLLSTYVIKLNSRTQTELHKQHQNMECKRWASNDSDKTNEPHLNVAIKRETSSFKTASLSGARKKLNLLKRH